MIDKLLLAIVGSLALLVVILIVLVTEATPITNKEAKINSPKALNSSWQPSVGNESSTSPQPIYISSRASSTVVDSAPKVIRDADLNSLASLVHLSAAKQASPSKDQWSLAIPVAQQLLTGPCDCEQRNWLNQFITMGNYALSDSPQYHQWAQLMDTLPLNNDNLKTHYSPTN